MWGSIVGGLIGAVVGALAGGTVTYYRERRLEARRRHEEAVMEMIPKVRSLWTMISSLVVRAIEATKEECTPEDMPNMRPKVFPEDAHELAREIEVMATRLDDGQLKRDVMRILNQEYQSSVALKKSLQELVKALRREAYPSLQQVKRKHHPNPVELREDDLQEKWAGPANWHFLNKLYGTGMDSRSEWENGD